MIVVWGFYRFARRQVGYRNDHCLACDQRRPAVLIRSFNAAHLFFIPFLPLGFYRRWECAACGADPHARVGSSKAFKGVAIAAFAFFTVFFWVIPIERAEDIPIATGLRIAMAAGLLAMIAWSYYGRTPVNLAEKLATVEPAPTNVCLCCDGALDAQGYCAACRVQRHELPPQQNRRGS